MNTLNLHERIAALRGLFEFDAVQLLAHAPGSDRHVEVWRHGYNTLCATALAVDFPRLYPPGFTRRFSPVELLPPSISESSEGMYPPFRTTRLYTGALHAYGFEDGMTLELGIQGGYCGLAHFSSRKAGIFDRRAREQARGVQGLLENSVREHLPPVAGQQETLLLRFEPGEGGALALAGRVPAELDAQALAQVLQAWPAAAQPLHCFWLMGRRSMRLAARRLQQGGVLASLYPALPPHGISLRELQVLSWLMAGLPDREIAACMGVGERTVHTHVAGLLVKLGLERRVQAAVQAAVNGWYLPDRQGRILAALGTLGASGS
ncbi:helix-turn-helix transcriptional regulator [Kerstersia gyiorum]|uniref:helix-turn-helix transcriptional regulator n=1 Tax=Kerstersia gyiorum TaxID=206506 RepID=UPI00209D06FF|nr:helix-turn-helix transcriptional regulator [Kerstersia gyiorum]MCP1633455.1 DNA-binding CsgD family transcriptional regulator [Kerstersia gyiorum]MCP1636326.1 DNA-binding CsgD family transcriptional regulator [Kerstersia gyiorum]MCP1671107.1 DNA-binding CsgD family transcriptional regulator [Kerstersia gyiorum]MCP1679236.1 DNA-binding CsgD family transcriptional regulator [Kerstersia gyiorum]MCP1682038.1 DNA-binding CsgD family transcriptional regulator [Kerstersia gyiorum]